MVRTILALMITVLHSVNQKTCLWDTSGYLKYVSCTLVKIKMKFLLEARDLGKTDIGPFIVMVNQQGRAPINAIV